jgi:hypothetical protein
VPEAFVESRKIPRRERLVEVLLVAVSAVTVVVARVEVPVTKSELVAKRLEVVMLEVEALARLDCPDAVSVVVTIPLRKVLRPAND